MEQVGGRSVFRKKKPQIFSAKSDRVSYFSQFFKYISQEVLSTQKHKQIHTHTHSHTDTLIYFTFLKYLKPEKTEEVQSSAIYYIQARER